LAEHDERFRRMLFGILPATAKLLTRSGLVCEDIIGRFEYSNDGIDYRFANVFDASIGNTFLKEEATPLIEVRYTASCRVGIQDRIAQRIGIGMVTIWNLIEALASLPAE